MFSTVHAPGPAEQEGKGIGLERLRRVGEQQLNAATVGQRLHLPGQLPGKAVLSDGEGALGQGQLVVREAAGDREQHREAAPHRLTRTEETLQIQVHHLAIAAAPAADQATALGHEPQKIAAAGIAELPVGIGSVALDQRHPEQGAKM